MFKYILFDLDGTLTDSSKGIINCVKYAMDAAGVTIENDDDLFEFIGPPLTDGFMTILGMNREEAERATTKCAALWEGPQSPSGKTAAPEAQSKLPIRSK